MTARPPGGAEDLPRYAEIRRDLEGRILSGEWPPGYRVPSEFELVERYGCSRMTVNKALSALAAAGLINRRRRSGSFVAAPRSQETVLEIHDIQAEIAATGKPYRYEVLDRAARPATAEEAGRLGVRPGAQVLALLVRHFADGRPFVVEDRLVDLATVPEALDEPFAAAPPGTWLIGRIPWTEAEHCIEAVAAEAPLARLLQVAKGTPCLTVERKTWQAGSPVTWVRLSYPGDRHRLVARFSPAGGRRQGA
ncbi:histidine utilization repressor [Arenibaculum pallidiluteum]|uniref:histidine utilization repressor n=1 Tax=Arenibaculum pallidiluteum TaxID=2812559 RepID=UPI001A96B66C|nr:histidine utilization repressor [Arenibaculum pallidiluteum]